VERSVVLCDLDGVVWRGSEPVPGAAAALSTISSAGCVVVFVTNNSNRPVAHYESRLEALGLEATGRVATSALAAATLVDGSAHTLVCAGPGVGEALDRAGRRWSAADIHPDDCPAEIGDVIVGLHHDFDYRRLHHASEAVRRGARLIGTNTDATFPTPRGEEPGGGSLLAAVATASGTLPIIAGKPHQPMADLVRTMTSAAIGRDLDGSRAVMIGDRSSTDGEFARRLGIPFAYVTSGVGGDRPSEQPALEAETLGEMLPELMALLTSGRTQR
jgi:4-nitrophenyl phosphatase